MSAGYLHDMIGRRRAAVKRFAAGFDGRKLKEQFEQAGLPRQVLKLLDGGRDVAVIAWFARANPVRREAAAGADPARFAEQAADGGAALICCATDTEVCRGSFDDLAIMRGVTGLPLIAWDFTVTSEQLALFRAFGADAAVVIAGQVEDKLPSFLKLMLHIGITPVVEVHSANELDDAIEAGAPLLLICAMDPDADFSVDRRETLELVQDAHALGALAIVAGIVSCRADVEEAAAAGADAVLVSKGLMCAASVRGAVGALTGVARKGRPHRTSVEVAGIMTPEQAVAAAHAGAEVIAVAIRAGSTLSRVAAAGCAASVSGTGPSEVLPRVAAAIFNALESRIHRVGVFYDADLGAVHEATGVSGLDAVELHGDASPDMVAQVGRPVIRALSPTPGGLLPLAEMDSYGEPVVSFLIEGDFAHDGWQALGRIPADIPVILSGGLDPENVRTVVHALAPAAVVLRLAGDETPEVVEMRVAAFISAVREADDRLDRS